MNKLISAGELIDQSWEHFRANFTDLMSISAWLLVKAIVDIVALALYPTVTKLATSASLNGYEMAGTALYLFSTAVVAPVLGVYVLVGVTRLIQMQLSGQKSDVRKAARDGWKFFWPTLWVSVLMVLVVFGAIVIGFGPSVVLIAIGSLIKNGTLILLSNILLVIGVFVATVLSFRWTVEFCMAPYALLSEGVRGRAALVRSRALVQGRFWNVLARYALPKLFFVIVSVILMSVVGYIAGLLVSAGAGLNLDVQLRLVSITADVIPILIAALVNPLLIVADVILYRNLIERGS